MMSWKDWQKADGYGRDYGKRMENETPEPLFETVHMPEPKICLRCAREQATSTLYSPFGMQPVLPLCTRCAADWNLAGYHILKDIKPKTLLLRLAKYKLQHPFRPPSMVALYRDIHHLLRWVRKMNRLKKSAADSSTGR